MVLVVLSSKGQIHLGCDRGSSRRDRGARVFVIVFRRERVA
jgi:hypothetical protein